MSWLADLVLVAHALVAIFVVAGLAAIWLGAWAGWSWTRNRIFRIIHIATVGVVAATAVIGVACPLTLLEDWLRGGAIGSEGFIQRWVGRLLYYDLPLWVFTTAYVAFGLAVMVTWHRYPPRQRP